MKILDKTKIKKVVLAYSGGLDTSVIIPWLKENYNNCEIIAVCANVGQADELEGLEEKALASGASKFYAEDLTDEFCEEFVVPALKAGAKYEGYLLGTALARPIIAKSMVEIAKKEGADAICHGATGKGNDQVRFELAIKAFAPDIQIIAPWREWDLKSREEEIEYAKSHNIPLKITKETNYSKDKNLWHLSHEGMDLEDPANEPKYDKKGFLELGVSPMDAPDKETYISLTFEAGVPTKLNGKEMSVKDIILELNQIGGKNGIGIFDLVENRLVGMKSRGVYETPGGTILYEALEYLNSICLDKYSLRKKEEMSISYGELIYNGLWFCSLRKAMGLFFDELLKNSSGEVKLKLYKGNIIKAGVTSPNSLYNEDYATFDAEDVFDHKDADGFITIFGLPIQIRAFAKLKNKEIL